MNWLTTRRVQLQNRAACSAETSTSISPLEMYGDIIIIIIKYREKGVMPVSPAHYNKQLH